MNTQANWIAVVIGFSSWMEVLGTWQNVDATWLAFTLGYTALFWVGYGYGWLRDSGAQDYYVGEVAVQMRVHETIWLMAQRTA